MSHVAHMNESCRTHEWDVEGHYSVFACCFRVDFDDFCLYLFHRHGDRSRVRFLAVQEGHPPLGCRSFFVWIMMFPAKIA